MANLKVIKLIGLGASVLGAAASVVASIASGKQQDAKITEEVAKAVAKISGEEA